MEIKEMDSMQIEERLSQIKSEIESAEGEALDALSNEVDALETRKKELKEQAEQRKAIAEKVNLEGTETRTIETTIVEEKRGEKTMEEVRNSKAYINAYAEYLKTNDPAECRALITENGTNGTIPVPELVYDIVKTAWDKEGIMALVKKTFIKGNLKVGFEISATGAVKHEEGASVNEETLTLGVVNIIPSAFKKWISISDEALDLRGEAFLRYIYEELTYQIAKACADEVVSLIEACGTVSTAGGVGVPTISETTIGVGTIAKAYAKLSDEASNPVVMMNKATWSNFKQAQYANNFSVDPFEGLPVVFNNSIEAFDTADTGDVYAIVGDLGQGVIANFPNGQEMTFKIDENTLATSDLVRVIGREFVGIGVVAPNAFVTITNGVAEG